MMQNYFTFGLWRKMCHLWQGHWSGTLLGHSGTPPSGQGGFLARHAGRPDQNWGRWSGRVKSCCSHFGDSRVLS